MKSKLQGRREELGLSIMDLSNKSTAFSHKGIDKACIGHMMLTIQSIETGKVDCPKPRKTYEYQVLAMALNCSVEEIMEVSQ